MLVGTGPNHMTVGEAKTKSKNQSQLGEVIVVQDNESVSSSSPEKQNHQDGEREGREEREGEEEGEGGRVRERF